MSLDDMIQTLAEQLDGPVVLYDDDLNLVAFSVHTNDVDEARKSVILSRRASARAQEMFAAHQVRKAHSPVRLPPYEGMPARVIYPVRLDRHLVGYIAYIDNAPGEELEAHHRTVLSAMESEIGALLALRSLQRRQTSEDSRRLLVGLLSAEPAGRAAASAELVDSGLLSSAARYAVMVFRSAHPTARSASGPRLAIEQALSVIVRSTSLKACGAVLGDEGVLVIPRPVKAGKLASLLRRPELESLRAGAGGSRDSLTRVHESHREAVLAWRAAAADPARYGHSAHWDDLGLDRLLVQLPLDSLTLDDLPPAVRRLLEAPSGAKLVETLESYLDHGADAQETARALVIHRSTLYYRLGRIHEIIESDLSDGLIRRDLHTGLRVATLAGLRAA